MPVEAALASALGEEDSEALAKVTDMLSNLARRLRPSAQGVVARQLGLKPGS